MLFRGFIEKRVTVVTLVTVKAFYFTDKQPTRWDGMGHIILL